MFNRILLLVAVSGSIALAAGNPSPSSSPTANPPTEASVKELLQVAQARKLVDSVMAQMDNLMQQAIAEAVHGQKIPEKVQKEIDQNRSEMLALMKNVLDWKKLEPMYVRIYQKTFTQPEIDGMIAFYKTPAGQAVTTKMPTAMQNTMDEMQQLMGPVMEKIQKTQRDIVAEMKAEGGKKGG